MCVMCVCFYTKLDSIEELRSLFFDPKIWFWSENSFKIAFWSHEKYVFHTYSTIFPSDFSSRWRVWFLWNLTGHENVAREKAQLTRALIFRLERTEMNMITFRYFRKSWIRGNQGIFISLGHEISFLKNIFRIFDHFCEHLSSWASSLNEGKSEGIRYPPPKATLPSLRDTKRPATRKALRERRVGFSKGAFWAHFLPGYHHKIHIFWSPEEI